MIDISITQLIIIILGTGGLAGTISSLVMLRLRKKKEEQIIRQEKEKAENLDIKNAKEVIELYKAGMKDLQNLMNTREKELSKKVADYGAKLAQYENENKELRALVKKLRETQLEIQTKLDAITMQSLQDCERCSFKSDCLKYKTKLYIQNKDGKDQADE